MRRWNRVIWVAITLLCTSFVAFAAGTSESPVREETSRPENIKFYGSIVEFSSSEPMIEALREELAGRYNIETIQVDWANLDRVIRTGIASGSPNDIYAKQPQEMTTYVDAGQALDLTPYLEANGGEWMNQFVPGTLEIGMYDGRYYNIPINTNFSAVFVNADLFDEAGVAIPDEWSWDEFMEASELIAQRTNATPFAIAGVLNQFLPRNGVLSLGNDAGILEDLAAGTVPASSPVFSTALENTRALFESGYWYPRQGAMTISRDEATAAFLQGRVAMLGEVTAVASTIVEGASFDVELVRWPAMGSENVVLGGADGFFIPINAPNIEGAVEVLRTFSSANIQQIHADAGYAAVNRNVTVSDPVIQRAIALSSDVYPHEFMFVSQRMADLWARELTALYILGTPLSEVLERIERLRLDAIQ